MPLDDDLAARMAEPDFWPPYLLDDQPAGLRVQDAVRCAKVSP
ncbi:hypothetical protein OHB53_46880 [Streptomyces sp. NBC_00056]|jgi:hypothetical protein